MDLSCGTDVPADGVPVRGFHDAARWNRHP
jgi:hypothetical protein